ncbi:FGGY family carbohydrate kinase [Oceanospirillum beijerinckii]|uniref:FGGY family carbohydrate kinase n=1 Tax=Oceanospirillum beijerinckii TaxID=64976 RepID=UPI0012FF0478
MSDYILSIDRGTTNSRAIRFSLDGQVHGVAQKEFPLHFPKDGFRCQLWPYQP